jgi:hypothetical protein
MRDLGFAKLDDQDLSIITSVPILRSQFRTESAVPVKVKFTCRFARLVAPCLLVLASGCLSLLRNDCSIESGQIPKTKSAKTLFSWAVGETDDDKASDTGNDKRNGKVGDEKRDAEKSQDDPKAKNDKTEKGADKGESNDEKNGRPEPKAANGNDADEPKPLESDRPDFTEASSTVGRGRIQLESGYTFIRDRANGSTSNSHSYPELLLRIGLFADWFELRLGQNFGNSRTLAPAFVENLAGRDDAYLGVKLALTEQKKYLPETALILQTTVPTGHRDFTAEQVLPGVNYLFGWDVIKDCLSCGGSLQANRAFDDVGHYYVEVAQSLTVGYTLTQKLGAYTEWFAFYPSGALSPDVGPQHYFDGGFTYKVTDNLQLDIRAGVGLNRHADDFFVGSGFAVRY